MNCSKFLDWLDEGMPRASESAARVHEERCPACAEARRAALEVDALLSRAAPAAPSALVDRVMEAIAVEHRHGVPVALWRGVHALPWWLEAAAQPASALALILAALLTVRIQWFSDIARAAASGTWSSSLGWIARTWAGLGSERPAMALGFWMILLPAVAWGSFLLYRWTVRIASRSAGV